MRERESLFNEYLIEVRKKEKEEKSQRREQVRMSSSPILMLMKQVVFRPLLHFIKMFKNLGAYFHLFWIHQFNY